MAYNNMSGTVFMPAAFLTRPDIAVATASILARDAFVTWIDKATEQFGFPIPKGASNKVQEAGEKLVAQHGTQILQEVSKTHFKTAQNWL